jgi:hypothetical protein
MERIHGDLTRTAESELCMWHKCLNTGVETFEGCVCYRKFVLFIRRLLDEILGVISKALDDKDKK